MELQSRLRVIQVVSKALPNAHSPSPGFILYKLKHFYFLLDIFLLCSVTHAELRIKPKVNCYHLFLSLSALHHPLQKQIWPPTASPKRAEASTKQVVCVCVYFKWPDIMNAARKGLRWREEQKKGTWYIYGYLGKSSER